jgi:excisionase family DNA binding protein
MTRLLNTKQLAAMTGVTPRTARSWLRNSWIPGRRVGRGYLISEEALHEFLSLPAPSDEEGEN